MPTSTVMIKIDGMHCAACVRRVTAALSKIPGVHLDTVEIGSARVQFDSSLTSPASISQAIDSIGFTAQPAV